MRKQRASGLTKYPGWRSGDAVMPLQWVVLGIDYSGARTEIGEYLSGYCATERMQSRGLGGSVSGNN